MKNAEAWDQYSRYTKDLTEISRKLGFAGAAIAWVLKNPDGSLSTNILLALIFFVGYFISDILQGLTGAILIRYWLHKEELLNWKNTESIEGEYLKPRWLDYPPFAFFLLKSFFLLLGFTYLGYEIVIRSISDM